MTENKPLKGKILYWNETTGDIETTNGRYFLETKAENGKYVEILLKSDVQSAVQGLLQEIDKAIKYYTVQNAINESTFRDERIEGLKIARNLIKKWFPDVFERGGENEAKKDYGIPQTTDGKVIRWFVDTFEVRK